MTRNRHKPKINGAEGPAMTKSVKRGNTYTGNARLIEIGTGGVPFRLLVNVDHIDCIRFEESFEEREVPIPGTDPVQMETKVVKTGWSVIIVLNGQQSSINFAFIEAAMNCYNNIVGMIKAVGLPHVVMGPLQPPKPAPKIENVDGKVIADAVDAAELHPDLAGGPGDGVAENDDNLDNELKLTNEDLELLEHPEIDIDGLEDVFAGREDPPAKN